jgi:transcriptional regulator with XRE-family HTH domain
VVDQKPAGNAPWDAFGTYLRNQRQLAQLSLRQLADLTKVSNPYLSQIERGLHRPSIAIIKSLAEALNLSTSDLLAHAADIVTDEEPATNAEGAIRNDPLLNDAQKSALLACVEGASGATGDATGDAVGNPDSHNATEAPSTQSAPATSSRPAGTRSPRKK